MRTSAAAASTLCSLHGVLLVYLLYLSALPHASYQLPGQPDCRDSLHYLAPETRCAYGRHPVYIMSDRCPAKSVCLSDAEVASCPRRLDNDDNAACPDSSPVRLLEYSPQEYACPRQRCVRLGCFDDFCRARRAAPPVALPDCGYVQCGCTSEADLIAQGCPAGELLILRLDSRTGCPAKRCSLQLPDSLVSLAPDLTTAPAAVTTATQQQQLSCPPRVSCPAGMSELTVPDDPAGGGCPLRICLLPELMMLNSDGKTSAAATAAATVTDVPHQTTTNSPPTRQTPSEPEADNNPSTAEPVKSVVDKSTPAAQAASTTLATPGPVLNGTTIASADSGI